MEEIIVVQETVAEELLFYDERYYPPVAVTEVLIGLANMNDRHRLVYELDARRKTVKEISDELEVSFQSARNTIPKVRSKMRNVFRAEGLVEDAVPTPLHRTPWALEKDEADRRDRALAWYESGGGTGR